MIKQGNGFAVMVYRIPGRAAARPSWPRWLGAARAAAARLWALLPGEPPRSSGKPLRMPFALEHLVAGELRDRAVRGAQPGNARH